MEMRNEAPKYMVLKDFDIGEEGEELPSPSGNFIRYEGVKVHYNPIVGNIPETSIYRNRDLDVLMNAISNGIDQVVNHVMQDKDNKLTLDLDLLSVQLPETDGGDEALGPLITLKNDIESAINSIKNKAYDEIVNGYFEAKGKTSSIDVVEIAAKLNIAAIIRQNITYFSNEYVNSMKKHFINNILVKTPYSDMAPVVETIDLYKGDNFDIIEHAKKEFYKRAIEVIGHLNKEFPENVLKDRVRMHMFFRWVESIVWNGVFQGKITEDTIDKMMEPKIGKSYFDGLFYKFRNDLISRGTKDARKLFARILQARIQNLESQTVSK